MVGYILPLPVSENPEDPQHLVMMMDGTMLATRADYYPNDPHSNTFVREQYSGYFSPNGLALNSEGASASAQVIDRIRRRTSYFTTTTIVADTNNPADADRFPELLGSALTEARSLQEQRIAAKRQRIAGANEMLRGFFNSSPGSEGPTAPPPQPPK